MAERSRSDLGGGEAHVDLGAEPHLGGAAVGVEVEVDALALAQRLEERALERVGGEGQLGAVGLVHDDALTRDRVEHADDALHDSRPSLRLLDLACLEAGGAHVEPLRASRSTMARTFCTFGFQRRLVRRCEWLMRIPNCGFLPHTSQTDAMTGNPCSYEPGRTVEDSSGPGTIPAVTVLQQLAPGDLRRIVSTYRDALRTHQDELNALNVYPVPDGDTGTNMALTLESVVGELDGATRDADATDSMEDVCEAIRHGSLMGARGNSGVILSQILRGLADTFSPLDAVSGADVAAGLRRAADAAYEAVLRPVEGTILTVVRSAAESVERAVSEGETTLAGVLERAAGAARDAVAQHARPAAGAARRRAWSTPAAAASSCCSPSCLNVVSGTPLPAAGGQCTPRSRSERSEP